ncbi:LysR family transcriptional regulator [Streptomyces albidoflavus]
MSSPEPAPRLLRAFLAVAEELHFTRAAARLYVAQQALSRDVRRLEVELGTELLVRSTRRAELTPDGERFVPYARRVLAAYEELGSAFGQARPLLVDVNSPGLVFERVLEHARRLVPELEVMARYESGLTGAALEIGAGRLDASFGRWAGLEPALRDQLDHQPVRLELRDRRDRLGGGRGPLPCGRTRHHRRDRPPRPPPPRARGAGPAPARSRTRRPGDPVGRPAGRSRALTTAPSPRRGRPARPTPPGDRP